jgi:hypothetical protein
LDVVVLNSRERPTILRNDTPRRGHWIQIHLRGTTANRYGIGAQVDVVCGDSTQTAEVHSGRGYQSHYGLRLHFGLGDHERIDRLTVRWLGGDVQILENVALDRVLTVVQR